MTNYDVIIEHECIEGREKVIKELSICLSDICEKIIYRMNREQDEHLEVNNFDKADMCAEFRNFFNHEIKK